MAMDLMKDHPLYRKHNIDSAMNSLWDFYKSRFVALFLISLAMSLALQYATSFINFKDLQPTADPMVILQKLKSYIVPMLLLMIVSLLFSNILHYYILHKPLESDRNFFVYLYKSLKYFIPYLIIIILLAVVGSFVIAAGIIVLIIGVVFSIAYIAMISFFILPVMMAEETNIGSTITRVVKLSHTNFWSNMGWTAVFLILLIIISIVLSGIVLIPFAGSFIKTFANPEDPSKIMNLTTDPVFMLLSSAVNALTLPLYPIFGFILYFNGKAREEGIMLQKQDNDSVYRVKVEDLYAKPRIDEEHDDPEKN
jgi:hypothetical protein